MARTTELIGYEDHCRAAAEANPTRLTSAGLPVAMTEEAYDRACKIAVEAPRTPGAQPTVLAVARTVDEAREWYREQLRPRRDLRSTDVRIEDRATGRLIQRGW